MKTIDSKILKIVTERVSPELLDDIQVYIDQKLQGNTDIHQVTVFDFDIVYRLIRGTVCDSIYNDSSKGAISHTA